jgi:hypothetical protein
MMTTVEVLLAQAYWLIIWLLVFGSLVLAPLAVLATMPGASIARRRGCVLLGYLLTVVGLGWYSYTWLPAQYAWQFDFTAPRSPHSLAAVHAKLLQANPQAAELRTAVEQERMEFVWRWVGLGAGGVLLLGGLLRRAPRRSPG